MLVFTIELITLNIADGVEFWSWWVGMLKFALFVSSWMHVLLRENWRSANMKLLCYGKSKWTEAAVETPLTLNLPTIFGPTLYQQI